MGIDWKRLQLLLTPEQVKQIDDWRRSQEDLPDRSEAIRRLVTKGLESERV